MRVSFWLANLLVAALVVECTALNGSKAHTHKSKYKGRESSKNVDDVCEGLACDTDGSGLDRLVQEQINNLQDEIADLKKRLQECSNSTST
ncbi:hypothetical protein BC940DRAFT_314488 [Gongronella butleri]|nr:hypothetical protein BC940DRAFT_314488 [Gongronella butleri]